MDKRLKVGFLLSGIGFVNGGAEQAFIEISKGLARKRNIEVIFFGGGEDLKIKKTKFIHIPLIKRNKFKDFPKFFIFINNYKYEEYFYACNLLPKLIKNPCDIYITCNSPFVFLTLKVLREIFNKRFKLYYYTQNGIWPTEKINEGKLFFTDKILCTNAIYFDKLKSKYDCILTPNGFNQEAWKSFRKQKSKNNKIKKILCVAALVKEKKIDIVIKAVSRLKDCKLFVVGEGPEFTTLKKLAQKLAPKKVIFAGGLPHNKVIDYYQNADLFVNIKEDEPFGIVFLEAMASGIPIIADNNKISRWILGKNGIFIRTDSGNELASCIKKTFRLKDLSARSEALRKRAYEEFTWEKTINKIYDNLTVI